MCSHFDRLSYSTSIQRAEQHHNKYQQEKPRCLITLLCFCFFFSFPAGSSISSESSPVSSPATNQSSPVSTPKRGPLGPVIVPPGGHSVPSTPPVVTIAPTKTVNGLWRSESRPVREVTFAHTLPFCEHAGCSDLWEIGHCCCH